MGQTRRKRRRMLVTKRIVYQSHKRPHERPKELTVNLPPGEMIDAGYATGMVAVRTGMPLENVRIVKIVDLDKPTR
ncbi:MAG: hypothetical protein ACRDTF_07345 [Pseudonocardiaceae bacterium]